MKAAFLVLAALGLALAQQDMGVITGLITDASGASVPGGEGYRDQPREEREPNRVTLRDIQPVSVRLFSGWFLELGTAFPSFHILSERSSPSRVRYAAPNTGAPLTAPGRSGAQLR